MQMRRSIQLLMAGSLICLPAAYARSNSGPQFNNPNIARAGDTNTTIVTTGVLEKGTRPGEYTMKTADGSTYNLTPSDFVNMRKCVGQKVIVTGNVMKHRTRVEERRENQPLTHLQVTNIEPLAS